VVYFGEPGTGKTRLATALVVSAITLHSKRVGFYSMEPEKHDGNAG
jgi:DNA replication protein DnaC